ncbi:hypothetical protein [Bacillus sp. AFS055030]|uniref:hypothetical protein n=1 Tax=Bacillus sp. AFS055030 TaxID=2033507 RepID=UPI000BFDE3C0|nr:hypothetical protein [Bacillus sp. AFS055030]PGL69439.1 hypothetical protein CN925_15405 [Bacillus sp. AFS055030]
MRKAYKFLIFASILALCLGGFYFEKMKHSKTKNEIWIGYNYTKFGKNVIKFEPVKVEKQEKLNQLEEIFLFSKKIDKPILDLSKYDVQLSFRSPIDQTVEYSSLLWFTNSGAIIKINGFNGYRSIGIEKANSIKNIINYIEL